MSALLLRGGRWNNGVVRFESTELDEAEEQLYHTLQRAVKQSFYKAGTMLLGHDLPWGSLTGVRPTKLPTRALLAGASPKEAKKELEKTYHVWVRGPVEQAAERLAQIRDLEGEPIRPARVETLRQGKEAAKLAVTIHQGKNRQVRRMCAACGLEVERLRRVREHTLALGTLPPGKWRRLTAEEVRELRGGGRERTV